MYSPVHLFYLQMQGLIKKIANEGWCRLYQMCEHRQFSIESTALDGRCGMLGSRRAAAAGTEEDPWAKDSLTDVKSESRGCRMTMMIEEKCIVSFVSL